MSAEALFTSLSLLPESMILEAMEAEAPARSPVKGGWIRAAACLALVAAMLFGTWFGRNSSEIVTAPGVLTVKAYGLGEDNGLIEYELKEGVTTYNEHGWGGVVNIVPGLPLTFSLPESEDLVLNISVNQGHFYDWHADIVGDTFFYRESRGDLGRCFSIEGSRTIYWQPEYEDPDSGVLSFVIENDPVEPIYVDVLIKADTSIVGYTVIEIVHIKDLLFEAYVLKSVSYPKVNGKCQNVTEEYVQEQIRHVKENRELER